MGITGPLRPNAGEHNKAMLKEYRRRVLDALYLCDEPHQEVCLPAISDIPFVSAGMRRDIYIKRSLSANIKRGEEVTPQDHCVSFIQKKEYYFGFHWQIKIGGFEKTINYKGFTWPWPTNCGFAWRATAKNLRYGVRWGIVPAESLTGKVINALGHYRIAAHERIIKGVISNSHRFKVALLDHYQDRLEALQELESLTNKDNSVRDYKDAIDAYILKLKNIQNNISKDIYTEVADKMVSGIDDDIKRSQQYLDDIYEVEKYGDPKDSVAFDDARGKESVLQFVKKQANFNLHELKSLNQFHTCKMNEDEEFKLTTGILGDCIEDGFNAIRNYNPDVSNIITPAHHGHFGTDDEIVVYNFKRLHLSPEREKEILLGISFIEEWDKVSYDKNNKPYLYSTNNGITQHKPLEEIAATFWRVSLNLKTFLKKVGMTLWNAVQSVLVRTQSWDENPWPEKDYKGEYQFRPYAVRLRRSSYTKTYKNKDPWYTRIKKLILGGDAKYTGARPNYPLWVKALRFLLKLGTGIADIGLGLREVGKDLFFHMPKAIKYDRKAAERKPFKNIDERLKALAELRQDSEQQIADIEHDFKLFLMGYKIKWMPKSGEQPEEDTLYVERKSDYVLAYKVWSQGNWLEGKVTLPEAMVDEYPDKQSSIYHRACGKHNMDATDLELRYLLDHLPAVIKAAAKNGHTQRQVGLNKILQTNLPRPSLKGHELSRLDFRPHHIDLAKQLTTHAKFAEVPYHLEQGYAGGPAGSAVEGLDALFRIFSENFAKAPLGATVYGTGYILTGGSVYLPKVFAFLGTAFTSWAQALGVSVASGGLSSAIASGAMVGQFGLAMVDVIQRGPSSGAVKTINFALDDPLSIGLGVGAAWLAGHMLTLSIPSLEHDLGTNKNIGKFTLGFKGMIGLQEAIEKAHQNPGKTIEFSVDDKQVELNIARMSAEQQAVTKNLKEKIHLAAWLNKHKNRLSMLDDDTKHDWIYHLGQVFGERNAASLKTLFYPEAVDRFVVQTVRMPLSYIPALFRAVWSCVSSIQTSSWVPMQIAWEALGHKILKDLARLLTVAEKIIRLIGRISIVPEVLTSIIIEPFGRIGGLAGINIFTPWSKFSARCSVLWQVIGEFLYDAFARDPIKSVTIEHPMSVVQREQSSSQMLLSKMPPLTDKNDDKVEKIDKEDIPEGMIVLPRRKIDPTSSSPAPSSSQSLRK